MSSTAEVESDSFARTGVGRERRALRVRHVVDILEEYILCDWEGIRVLRAEFRDRLREFEDDGVRVRLLKEALRVDREVVTTLFETRAAVAVENVAARGAGPKRSSRC